MFFLPLFAPQWKDSLHSFPVPLWCPSHGNQSSTNFSFPQAALIHNRLHLVSLPWGAALPDWAAPVEDPPLESQCRSLSTGCSPSRTACSTLGPLQHHKSHQETAAVCKCTGPCQEPAPVWAPSTGSWWIFASPMGCRAELPHLGLHHGLQGISASKAGAPTAPPSLTVVSDTSWHMQIELFQSHIHAPLFSVCNYFWAITLLFFLNLLSHRCSCLLWMTHPWPAVSVSEWAGTGPVEHGGTPCPRSHAGRHACYKNIDTQVQYIKKCTLFHWRIFPVMIHKIV